MLFKDLRFIGECVKKLVIQLHILQQRKYIKSLQQKLSFQMPKSLHILETVPFISSFYHFLFLPIYEISFLKTKDKDRIKPIRETSIYS